MSVFKRPEAGPVLCLPSQIYRFKKNRACVLLIVQKHSVRATCDRKRSYVAMMFNTSTTIINQLKLYNKS